MGPKEYNPRKQSRKKILTRKPEKQGWKKQEKKSRKKVQKRLIL